jgi:ribosome biogenesis protein Tsr3
MATALCSIGYLGHAKFIMSKFGWADGFWQQNPSLGQYSLCNSLDEIKIKSK